MIKSEEEIKNLFGVPAEKIDVTMLNINSSGKPLFGLSEEDSNAPHCIEYLEYALNFYPSIMKSYLDKRSKFKNKDPLEVADDTFTSVWISPDSSKKLKYPKPFGGDHRTEATCSKLGIYSTQQILARYTNSILCAALSSKLLFDSAQVDFTDLLTDPSCVGDKEISYCLDRGVVKSVGEKAVDHVKYIAVYNKSNNKLGTSLICGDKDFLFGYVNISRRIEAHINELRKMNTIDQYKGVHLSPISLSGVPTDDNEERDIHSICLSRLIAGSILVSDHLKILKTIYGVKKVLKYDLTYSRDPHPVDIDEVINEYNPIKKYLVMAKTLNSIQ